MTVHESLIQALRFCASGEKFPRLCTEACPLYCAKGNAKRTHMIPSPCLI